MIETLEKLESEGLDAIGAVADAAALEEWRIAYLGSKGRLKAAMAGMKDVPKDQKPAFGSLQKPATCLPTSLRLS